jgi:hypothetical protein
MKKFLQYLNTIKILSVFFVLGLFLSIVISTKIVSADFPLKTTKLPVNQNGQTYGEPNLDDPYNPIIPDLALAIGIDGTKGYISTKEHDDYIMPRPQNQKEIAIYMEKLTQMVAEARVQNSKYLYYIPLYEADGTTIIGKYGVSIPQVTTHSELPKE